MDGYVNRIETAEDPDELCYFYEGDWDELMSLARSDIAEAVEKLKNS